jgi:hypothetical protein
VNLRRPLFGRQNRSRRAVRLTALCGTLGLIGWAAGSTPAAASTKAGVTGAPSTMQHLTSLGTVNLRALAASPSSHASAGTTRHLALPGHVGNKNAATTAVPVPNPGTTAVVKGKGGTHGFVGVTVLSQAQANGDTRLTLEPPDQGLCAHSGVIVEPVNTALQVYSSAGQALSPVVSLNAFFHLPPEVNFGFNPPTFGPFTSDPRCYYDAQTGRWFLTVLEIDVDPYTGAFGFRSHELLAVSQTSDPLGGWALFEIDSTNDGSNGTPKDLNCPCFGDQPRIGADANGFYIATDIYPIHGVFNSDGGELYAVSKTGLAAAAIGGPAPVLVVIHNGAVIVDGNPANALQPAETPQGGSYAANTEYFLNNPDYNGFATSGGQGETAVELWTLTGTSTLNSATPVLTLTTAELPSQAYAPPIPAVQKTGPIPYGTSIGATAVPPLSVNDDRMQQVQYLNGKLYSSLNTGIGAGGVADRSGVAWFEVTPSGGGGGAVTNQGYVAVGAGATLLYPSIGLTSAGEGVMTFSISGPTHFPSAAFMSFDGSPSGSVFINGPGVRPEDGFTCYSQAGFGPACRWGDYTRATSDGTGAIVMGAEMIPNAARATDSNWGTFVSIDSKP